MKLGACTQVENLPILKEMGLDYWEINFSKLAMMEEEEFEKTKRACQKYALPTEAANGFFSAKTQLYEADEAFLRNYCETGFSRLKALGGAVAVLGSGSARNIPEGIDRAEAEGKFIEVLRICGDVGAKYGIQIAIEPLRAEETNFINTVAEGFELCRKANLKNVRCLADFYHVSCANEPLPNLIAAGKDLVHLHLSAPDREIPCAKDTEVCKIWKKTLDEMRYKGRMSLEGKWPPVFEAALQNVMPILELFR